jgi:hypothetical protein
MVIIKIRINLVNGVYLPGMEVQNMNKNSKFMNCDECIHDENDADELPCKFCYPNENGGSEYEQK